MIHIANKDAVMTQLPPKKVFKAAKTDEELKEEEEKNKDKPKVLKDSKGRILKAPEVVEETGPKDSYGRVIKELPKIEKAKEVKMIQDGSMKKTIAAAEEEGDRFIKH